MVGNGLVVTLGHSRRVIPDGAVVIDGDSIVEVGPSSSLRVRYPKVEFLDARGCIIMPGMINIHMHCYGAFARGIAIGAQPRAFVDILRSLWWKLDRALTPEDVYVSALLGFSECLRNGTTTVFDHHASPNAVEGSLDAVADAALKVGVRASLCYEVSDRDGSEVARRGIEENVRFISACREKGRDMLTGCMGLHASFTLSDETLLQAVEEARRLGVGCHIHVAEGREDVEDSMIRHNKRVVQRLADLGVLGEQSIAAHCVHVSQEEMEILAGSHAVVAHNAQSNMNNAVGSAPALAMLEKGVHVGLGTDGFTSDMFEAAACTTLLHKFVTRDPGAGWAEVERMAFVNNPDAASRVFGRRVGALEPGACADLIVVDYDPPTEVNQGNFWAHFLFGVRGGQVRHAIVNGRVVMRDRCILGVDDARLRARARELSAALWKRFYEL